MTTDYQIRGPVAVLTLNNPPINSMGLATRQAFVAALSSAQADPAVGAIVITGAGKAFSGGADIREFGTPAMMSEPSLHSMIRALESSSKPVISAIHGVCIGGGLELSLGAHYRVALADAQVGLPEVKLGLLPGAGGTQRLPRTLGVEAALNLIVSGEMVAAGQLAKIPGQKLFDRVIEGDLLAGALAFADEVIANGCKMPSVRELKARHAEPEAYFQFARNTVRAMAKNYPAPVKCVDAVAASVTQPFDEGLRTEGKLFLELLHTPESKALRHAFFAERAASKIPDVPDDTPSLPIKAAAVIGAGTMGGGIAMNFLNAGIPVKLLETKQEALDKGMATIRKNYENTLKKGKLSQEKFDQRLALLSGTLAYGDLAQADLIIEAVFEDMSVKQQVFQQLDAVAKPGAILASNTSTLNVDTIAQFTQRPESVVGMHFFSPANVMKLLEVVRGAATSKAVLATVMQVAKKIRKTAVVSGVCDGFIGNRMIEQYSRQASFLLDEGCSPEQIDKACEQFGFAMGPFRMGDLAGNDIGWAIRKRRYVEQPTLVYSRVADKLCELGRYGQKTGAGWYDYKPGDRHAHSSSVVADLLVQHRAALGLAPRKISATEIVERLVFALVNEAALILDEGIASKASDIDMVYLTGYGFPVWRGGPMNYADEVGLYHVVQTMHQFARNPHSDPASWQVAPLLQRLVAAGKGFTR